MRIEGWEDLTGARRREWMGMGFHDLENHS